MKHVFFVIFFYQRPNVKLKLVVSAAVGPHVPTLDPTVKKGQSRNCVYDPILGRRHGTKIKCAESNVMICGPPSECSAL